MLGVSSRQGNKRGSHRENRTIEHKEHFLRPPAWKRSGTILVEREGVNLKAREHQTESLGRISYQYMDCRMTCCVYVCDCLSVLFHW